MHKKRFVGLLSFSAALCLSAAPASFTKESIFIAPSAGEFVCTADGTAEQGIASYSPTDSEFLSYKSSNNDKTHHDYVGNIYDVWDNYQGDGVRVAVIDSGIDTDHPDFFDEDGNSIIDYDSAVFITHVTNSAPSGNRFTRSRDGNGDLTSTGSIIRFYTDTEGSTYSIDGESIAIRDIITHWDGVQGTHGTNVASTIASYPHDVSHVGTIGIAPKVTLVPIKIDFFTDTIGAALGYVHELNTNSNPNDDIDVVNISIEATSTWSTIAANAQYCVNDGTIIFASGGNHDTSTKYYPASDPNIIGVGALDKFSFNTKADYSNYNSTFNTNWENNVDITIVGNVYVAEDGGTYKETHGTSFSSPICAAGAALWKQKYPNKTYSQFLSELKDACIDIGSTGNDAIFGYGRLDVSRLVGLDDIVAPTSLNFACSTFQINPNDFAQLTLTASPSGANTSSYWSSSNSNIVEVDENGLITAKHSGTATITAVSKYNSNLTATCTVTVTGTYYSVEDVVLDCDDEITLKVGQQFQIEAHVLPTNAGNQNLVYSVDEDGTSFASVNGAGLITALAEGETLIGVFSEDDSTISKSIYVNVIPDPYYQSITATDAAGLSAQLHNLMFDTHTWYSSYDNCRNENGAYYAMDPGTSESYLTDFYTQHDIDKTWSGNSSGTWNREHIWCQSKSAELWNNTSGSTRGGGADYHHIRPIEHDLNSTRNNNTYGEVENKNSSTAKYSKTSNGTNAYLGGYLENGVWEPLPSIKGDIARILMYIWVHYATDAGGTTPSNYSSYVGNLKLNDIICEGTSVSASKAMLLKWHNNDPVDESERTRNEVAYSYQGNRNPFIDHPEYANIIFATDVVHVNSVSLNTNSLTLLPGGTSTLTATVLPVDANNRNVTWSTSDAAVATVSNGTVTAVAPGTATITCCSVDGNKTDTCTVTVNPRSVTKVELNKEELSIPCGSTDSTLSVTVSPDNATYKTVTWSVIEASPSGCVTVDANGKVKGVAIGTAKVKVTSTSDSTKYDTCTVTVTPVAVTSITITCSKTSLKVGNTSQVNISSIIPSGATNKAVEWISSNDSVLTVDSNGLVTAVGPGTANVTAKAKDGSNVVSNAKSFTVGDILLSIEFSNLPTNNTVFYMSGDGNFNLSVTAHYQSGASADVTSELTSQSIVAVDTTKLGKQHVKAYFKFDGVTKNCEADITVTNVGSASHSETIEGTEITTEIKSKTFYNNGNTVIDGVTFSLNAKTSHFGSTDATKGQAIGKNGDGPDTMSLTQNNQARVTRVAITTSGAVGINGATLRVKVGSIYFAYNSNPTRAVAAEAGDIIDTATITSTSTEYVFEGDATGNITAEWTQTSDVAIYIKKFKVNTETTTVNSFSGQEQADAWATYFIDITRGSNGPCLLSNEAQKKSGLKALWNTAKTEYLNMEAAGKNAFCSSQPNFLVEECMKHYRYIVDTYGEEAGLEDFVVDGSGNAPVHISETRRLINEVFNDSAIAIALISVVGIAAIGAFVIYKKRKYN